MVLCDFKTAPVKPEYLDKYWVQLHAYAYALEHPAPGSLHVSTVDRLGLAVFEPGVFSYDTNGGAALSGPMRWIDLARDDDRFISFLSDVAKVIEAVEPPASSRSCGFCRYRLAA